MILDEGLHEEAKLFVFLPHLKSSRKRRNNINKQQQVVYLPFSPSSSLLFFLFKKTSFWVGKSQCLLFPFVGRIQRIASLVLLLYHAPKITRIGKQPKTLPVAAKMTQSIVMTTTMASCVLSHRQCFLQECIEKWRQQNFTSGGMSCDAGKVSVAAQTDDRFFFLREVHATTNLEIHWFWIIPQRQTLFQLFADSKHLHRSLKRNGHHDWWPPFRMTFETPITTDCHRFVWHFSSNSKKIRQIQ